MTNDNPRSGKIRVLIIEDSVVLQKLLKIMLESDPEIEVIGIAGNGEEGLAAVEKLKPDVITMDIIMPRMNGLEATREIMCRFPTPIVIISGSMGPGEVRTTFNAIEAGALAHLGKPSGPGSVEFQASIKKIIRTVKSMAEVKVVRRWKSTARPAEPARSDVAVHRGTPEIVVIGASTGGPVVLQKIFMQLPQNLPFPIVVVQHMSPGFVEGFAQWLTESTGASVSVAKQGEILHDSKIYIAPDDAHLTIGRGRRIQLIDEEPISGLRPAVSKLFKSAGAIFGSRTLAILLTGMGSDGAEELRDLKALGATTIIQDKESCVVFGMPGVAAKYEAQCHSFSPEEIANYISRFASSSTNDRSKPAENVG